MSSADEKSTRERACDSPESVDRRHLSAYRRFQNTSLRALTGINKLMKGEAAPGESPVKVGELKGLVSAYREAAQAERAVLCMNNPDTTPRTGEMVVRWVDDDEPVSAGYGDA